MQYLKMYKIYCANQPTALKVLEAQQEANPAFAAFLQECLLDPKVSKFYSAKKRVLIIFIQPKKV